MTRYTPTTDRSFLRAAFLAATSACAGYTIAVLSLWVMLWVPLSCGALLWWFFPVRPNPDFNEGLTRDDP